MVLYRRNYVPGGTYFFAVALRNPRLSLLTDWIEELRHSVRHVLRQQPFRMDAWVVLPEHLHAVWTLPPGDADYSSRWKTIKGKFSHRIAKAGAPVKKKPDGSYDVWQDRFWEHTIRNEADFSRHIDYIHYNPVKHRHVNRVRDWPFSTFRHYVKAGVYPVDWAGNMTDFVIDYDE